MPSVSIGQGQLLRPKPRFRGVLHEWGFYLSIPLGITLGLFAETPRARVAAAIFAASVVGMFGASALYHRFTWTTKWRRRLRQLDHAGIYGLIAGSYTPFGLLVLDGAWRVTVLGIVWTGALTAVLLKFVWPEAPKWLSALSGISLGWVGVVVYPQIVERTGVLAAVLVLLGGLCYTLGAIVYARRRPDPRPGVLGYHEIFHAFTIAAVALHYTVVAFFVLPT